MRGVGLTDADYAVTRRVKEGGKRKIVWICPYYRTWSSMLQRCYSGKFAARCPTYADCEVCDEWLTFSTFKSWMEAQDWEGMQLDKDLLLPGNRVYSPGTCVFVSGPMNLFLTDHGSARGEWPIGVAVALRPDRFVAHCNNPFTRKLEHLGVYSTPEEAHEAWRKRKHELACQYADMQTDTRIAQALRSRFDITTPSHDELKEA